MSYSKNYKLRAIAYLLAIKDLDPSKIVYIDEVGFLQNIYREYAYSLIGQPVIDYITGKREKRVGLVAAKMGKEILEPYQYSGTMNSQFFEAWFSVLLPKLPANSTIVMDNAAFHRKSVLPAMAEAKGHRIIFLPPYSPELNPIEHTWFQMKSIMKQVIHTIKCFDDRLRYCFTVL